jgi:hypothetical protein
MKKRLTRAEKRERTYEELILAAEKLFIEQGFHATSVDEIAFEAGYTKGAVYSSKSSVSTGPPRVSSSSPPMRHTGVGGKTVGLRSTSSSGRT